MSQLSEHSELSKITLSWSHRVYFSTNLTLSDQTPDSTLSHTLLLIFDLSEVKILVNCHWRHGKYVLQHVVKDVKRPIFCHKHRPTFRRGRKMKVSFTSCNLIFRFLIDYSRWIPCLQKPVPSGPDNAMPAKPDSSLMIVMYEPTLLIKSLLFVKARSLVSLRPHFHSMNKDCN